MAAPLEKQPAGSTNDLATVPMERRLARWMLRQLGEPPVRFVLWDGSVVHPQGDKARFDLVFHRRTALWRLLTHPLLHFGEDYVRGDITVVGDLAELIETVYRGLEQRRLRQGRPAWQRLLLRVRPAPGNDPHRSRHNVHHHYDLGNDFYRLWLDEEMVYTCAYYPQPGMDLEAAQRAKMDHVARKLRLRPGERVVEAGCGWGGLSRYLARHYGVHVTAYNISKEQLAYCRERARKEGLEDRIDYVEADWRDIQGRFDVFVSVGMLEHVGRENYPALGQVMNRVLGPDGRGLIHSIGQDRGEPLGPWIQKYIFPGAYPPTLAEMMELFRDSGFSVEDVENLRLHYARTLEHWIERFEAHADEVRALFDETFVRTWRFYLNGSLANFRAGSLQLFQVVFHRRGHKDLPWTRAHLYE